MSTNSYDPNTLAQDLFYKVVGTDGSVSYQQARTWGPKGNANVLASRVRDYEKQNEDARADAAKKGEEPVIRTVEQVTEAEYIRNTRRKAA